MSIIECIRDYISSCPLLIDRSINVNYLGAGSVSYSIDNIPAEPVIKRYCDGGTLRQFCFSFACRDGYDDNALLNLKVSGFFEEFAKWIEEQNRKGCFPDIEKMGLTPIKIEITKSGYAYDTARTSARFQIELRILYRQDV